MSGDVKDGETTRRRNDLKLRADLLNQYQTDRHTDILLTEIKVIIDLFVIVIREIYVHVYTRMLVC